MKKSFIILILGFLYFNNLIAEEANNIKPENTISFELGGNGFLYSFNYEKHFNYNINTNIGLSYIYFVENGSKKYQHLITLPIMGIYQYEIANNSHFLEFGLGIMFMLSTGNISSYEDETDLFPNITSKIGYRYQIENSNWNYRIAFTPYYGLPSITKDGAAFSIFGSSSSFQIWGSIGIGYNF